MVEDGQGRKTEAPDETESPEEAVARGRASTTPFVLLGGTALVIWAVVAVIAAVLLVVWWLV